MSSSVFSIPDMAPTAASRRFSSVCSSVPCDFVGQQSLQQANGLQWLPQIMARCGQEARLGGIGVVGGLLGGGESFRGALAVGDVRECDHDAFDRAFMRAIRKYEPIVQLALRVETSLSMGVKVVRTFAASGIRSLSCGARREIGERSADIRGDHPEQRLRRRREESDP